MRFVDVAAVGNASEVWNEIRDASPESAFVNSYLYHRYALAAAAEDNVVDRSFFAYLGERPVAVAPLHVSDVRPARPDGWSHRGDEKARREREACFYAGPLSWPCMVPITEGPDAQQDLEDTVFDELESRAVAEGAGRIRIVLFPATPSGKEKARYLRLIRGRRYIDARYQTHEMQLNESSLENVRERYRRYVKKHARDFEMLILERGQVTDEVEQAYFDLHVKDAGGQYRPRESYARQLDVCRRGEGFCVMARDRKTGSIVGGLLVALNRTMAIDWSVAVDPAYRDQFISHLMKWTTIETLLRRGYETYELGIKAEAPTLTWQPTDTQYGITFFKEGWARDGEKTIWLAEKYFDRRLLDSRFDFYREQLAAYFGLPPG